MKIPVNKRAEDPALAHLDKDDRYVGRPSVARSAGARGGVVRARGLNS